MSWCFCATSCLSCRQSQHSEAKGWGLGVHGQIEHRNVFTFYFLILHIIISYSPFHFLPLYPLICPLPDHFQIHGLFFSMIVITCIYSYIFLKSTSSVCMLLMHMGSGLTIWCWITSWWALPWGCLFLPLSVVFILQLPVILCVGLRLPQLPDDLHFSLSMVIVQLTYRQPYWWDFMRVTSGMIRRHSLATCPPILWLLQSFLLLLCSIP